ncbi:MAG: hypothetical protein AAB452_01780 [Patescibacteria group bacterium]
MSEMTKLQQAAKAAFIKEIGKRIKWLAEDCWPENLEYSISRLNQIVEAARSFEVTALESLTDAETTELMGIIRPMRALEMKVETRETIISLLERKGLEKEVFHPVIVDETPA